MNQIKMHYRLLTIKIKHTRSLKSLIEFGFKKPVAFKTNFTEEDDDTKGNGNSIKGFYTSNYYSLNLAVNPFLGIYSSSR